MKNLKCQVWTLKMSWVLWGFRQKVAISFLDNLQFPPLFFLWCNFTQQFPMYSTVLSITGMLFYVYNSLTPLLPLWLVWSQFLDQGSNLGSHSESTEACLLEHQGFPDKSLKKKPKTWNYLVGQWLGLGVFTALGLGLIPDGGTKNCNMTLAPSKKLWDSHFFFFFFLRVKEESRMAGVWLCIRVDVVHPFNRNTHIERKD